MISYFSVSCVWLVKHFPELCHTQEEGNILKEASDVAEITNSKRGDTDNILLCVIGIPMH